MPFWFLGGLFTPQFSMFFASFFAAFFTSQNRETIAKRACFR